MFEKVNPAHPDKIADRIAGAIVDIAYSKYTNPHVAVEVLIGHHEIFVIIESDVINIKNDDGLITAAINRIAGGENLENIHISYNLQDKNLNNNQLRPDENQSLEPRCGDNGIFKPSRVDKKDEYLVQLAHEIYQKHPSDGKYLIDNQGVITICQSNVNAKDLYDEINSLHNKKRVKINPIGPWSGGTCVDCGATNRKIGSDMGDGATGGGLHGKDLSKADVTMNICAYLFNKEYSCSIGDKVIDNHEFGYYISAAHDYISSIGGFEKFAEWGLIRPRNIHDNDYSSF